LVLDFDDSSSISVKTVIVRWTIIQYHQ
jgi:hypothetical protein